MGESVDAAWAEAEAALPEGWALEGVTDESRPPVPGTLWEARSRSPYLVVGAGPDVVAMLDTLPPRADDTVLTLTTELGGTGVAYESRRVTATGPTPAAALRALAARLRDPS